MLTFFHGPKQNKIEPWLSKSTNTLTGGIESVLFCLHDLRQLKLRWRLRQVEIATLFLFFVFATE